MTHLKMKQYSLLTQFIMSKELILPILVIAYSVFSGQVDAKQKLDLFFEYFNNFPEFYKWLILGIFGSIYGLKPGMDLVRNKKK